MTNRVARFPGNIGVLRFGLIYAGIHGGKLKLARLHYLIFFSDLKRREEKAFKQSGNRSRADSGNVASGGSESGAVSTHPDALSPAVAAAASDATAADAAPPVRIRERRSNKSTNYDSALKTPFPRRAEMLTFLLDKCSRLPFQRPSTSPCPRSRP